MNVLKFRPFRIINGQIIVTDYLGWRKLVTNNNNGNTAELSANLNIVLNQHVVNHKGEKLYFPSEKAFDEYPIIKHRCYDCEGVPTFSHITKKSLNKSDYRMCFEPLYTNIIVREFHAMNERMRIRWVKSLPEPLPKHKRLATPHAVNDKDNTTYPPEPRPNP